MAKATVFRIEHGKTKCGMYVADQGLYSVAEANGDDICGNGRHPLPAEDSTLMSTSIPRNAWGIGNIEHLHFGFATVEQLRSWLYKDVWLLGLHEAGFVLAIIEADEVYIGSTQAVFLRPDAYETVSIKDYFNL